MNSRLTPEQIQLLKDELTTELAGFLVDDFQLTPQEWYNRILALCNILL